MAQAFYNKDDEDGENNLLGEMHLTYNDDIYLDIVYKSGETFRAIDYLQKRSMLSLDDAYQECLGYHDSIVNLFEKLFEYIDDAISLSPLFKISERKVKSNSINFDKYFKIIGEE